MLQPDNTMKKIIFILLLLALLFTSVKIVLAQELADSLRGRIILQVESKGKAWYVDPTTKQRAFLGRPEDSFRIMRELGLGISNKNLDDIASLGEKDKNTPLAKKLAGKILLQVEAKGEAYYINPVNLKKYYLGRPTDAFNVMRTLGLGISNNDINKISVLEKYKEPVLPTTSMDAMDRIENAILDKLKK